MSSHVEDAIEQVPVPGCLALALTRAWWAWLLLASGVAVLALEAVVIGLQETANAHDLTAARWIALSVVLVLMLVTYVGQVLAAVGLARGSTISAAPARRAGTVS